MADGSGGCLWPGPVTFNDDDPKKGYCTLFLSTPGMKVNKALLGKATPKNATVTDSFTSSSACLNVTVTDKEGKSSTYEYKKGLPEDIDPEKTSYKVKDGMVVLSLCKENPSSWAAHAKYMIRRE